MAPAFALAGIPQVRRALPAGLSVAVHRAQFPGLPRLLDRAAPCPPVDRPDQIRPLLTAREAAERLGIPVRRVRAAIRARELRAVRIGRWARVTEQDLAAWLDRLRGKSRQQARAAREQS